MNRIIYILIFISIYFFISEAKAQSPVQAHTADILQKLKRHPQQDTVKVNLLNALSWQYYKQSNRDASKLFADSALKLSLQLHFLKGQATAQRYLANIFTDQGNTSDAEHYYISAFNISKQIRDTLDIINNLKNLGLLYSQMPNAQKKSIENYKKAIDLVIQTKDSSMILNCYNDITNVCIKMQMLPIALEYCQKFIDISTQFKNNQYKMMALTLMASIYRYSANNENEIIKSATYFERAFHFAVQIKDTNAIIGSLFNIGNVYYNALVFNRPGGVFNNFEEYYKKQKALPNKSEEYDKKQKALANKSEEYYLMAIEVAKKNKNNIWLGSVYSNISILYEDIGDYAKAYRYILGTDSFLSKSTPNDQALLYLTKSFFFYKASDSFFKRTFSNTNSRMDSVIKYGTKALDLSRKVFYVDFELQSLAILIQAYDTQRLYKEAYLAKRNLIEINEISRSQDSRNAIVRLQLQYQFDQEKAEAKVIQQRKDVSRQNRRNALLAGLTGLLLFTFILYRQRNKIRKEKNISDKLLLNILPADIALELKQKGSADAQQFDNVSLLFVHLNISMNNEISFNTKQMVDELHECFTVFDKIIGQHGLEKIKSIGNTYIAVCGLPRANPQHALKTVQVANDFLKFIDKRTTNNKEFDIRIGINSGSVVAGIVGIKKFAFDIWGDTVNTAARMQQNSVNGTINISESTYQLVKDEIDCTSRGAIEAKGKGKVEMYFVNPLKPH